MFATNRSISKIFKNTFYAFFSQGLSFCLSLLTTLFLPKFLGLEGFGHWQLFIFYSSYVGFGHLGLNDGIYLRYGGMQYNEINKEIIGSQFWFLFFYQVILVIFGVFFLFSFPFEEERMFIGILVCLFFILANSNAFLGFLFQATHQVFYFSSSVVIEKVTQIFAVVSLLSIGVYDYKYYIISYTISKLFALSYCMFIARKTLFYKLIFNQKVYSEIVVNISTGFFLMFSNVAELLVIGVARFFVDMKWGVEEFGKVSFFLSLTYFFLFFISQISMVLFPTLRQLSAMNQKNVFLHSLQFLRLVLPLILLLYLPICSFLEFWLPKYHANIKYLVFLLPLCVFEGEMRLLFKTFFQVLRKERQLLILNIVSVILSLILVLFGVFVFNELEYVMHAILIVTMLRSIIAQKYLCRIQDLDFEISKLFQNILIVCISIAVYSNNLFFAPLYIGIYYFIVQIINYKDNIKLYEELRSLVR